MMSLCVCVCFWMNDSHLLCLYRLHFVSEQMFLFFILPSALHMSNEYKSQHNGDDDKNNLSRHCLQVARCSRANVHARCVCLCMRKACRQSDALCEPIRENMYQSESNQKNKRIFETILARMKKKQQHKTSILNSTLNCKTVKKLLSRITNVSECSRFIYKFL